MYTDMPVSWAIKRSRPLREGAAAGQHNAVVDDVGTESSGGGALQGGADGVQHIGKRLHQGFRTSSGWIWIFLGRPSTRLRFP